MATLQVGVVSGLWRFPVKSMLGEAPARVDITSHGVLGDRAWALRELATKRIVTAKRFSRMLQFRARYDVSPESDGLAPATIILPDGATVHADAPEASRMASSALGCEVRIEGVDGTRSERAGIDPRTVFGDVAVEQVFPGLSAGTMPPYFALKSGSFFDSAAIHLLATGTLSHIKEIAAPGSDFDPRRFRPNILVDTGDRPSGFIEDEWEGGVLRVGDDVRIVEVKPALRCAMTTHQQEDLPRDMAILRSVARHHRVNLGAFASIDAPGAVRLGDPVFLEK